MGEWGDREGGARQDNMKGQLHAQSGRNGQDQAHRKVEGGRGVANWKAKKIDGSAEPDPETELGFLE